MKKRNLATGILYVFFGMLCLVAALLTETGFEGILWGFASAGIVPGAGIVCRYVYWNAPKNKARYEARLENEWIEMHDELKTAVRDKAGRYAYTLGLLALCFGMLLFCVLDALGIIGDARVVVLCLGGCLLFQILAGIVIFHQLMKKY